MKQIKRYFAVSCSIVLLSVTVVGCSNTSNQPSTSGTTALGTTSSSEGNSSSEANSSSETTTEYGKVTAVDGTSVTIALGTMAMGGGNKPDGQMPSASGAPDGQQPPSASGAPDGQQPPSASGAPDGQQPPSASGAPDGQMPNGSGNGMGGGKGGFTESGETKTITISDTSLITVMSGPGSTTSGSLDSITVDSILMIEYDTNGNMTGITVMNMQKGNTTGTPSASGESGSSTGSIELTSTYTLDGTTDSSDGESIDSTISDQNTVLVKNNGSLTLSNATLTKSGNTSSNDESNFYGLNSIFCVAGGSTASISDTKLTSSSEGSNAIFSTGEGSTINVSNVTINTSGDSARGLDATYGGTIHADNVTITTTGAHCAPIATDRGEGTITVDTGILRAAGDGSPCIYSTGDITATNVTGVATGSQCAVVEGKNKITISNCDLTGAGPNGIMLYQSTSGDAAEGTCVFTANDCKLTTTSTGEMFYITNTDAEINLTNTTLSFSSGTLLNAAGNNTNNWGKEGANGGNVTLNATNQTLKGDITCDSISAVALNLASNSTFTGAIDSANTGDVTIALDKDTVWEVTGTSYVSSLTLTNSETANIHSNGYTIYYDSSNNSNSWLNGKTVELTDGGTLAPR